MEAEIGQSEKNTFEAFPSDDEKENRQLNVV
jgi:hypothetical protein